MREQTNDEGRKQESKRWSGVSQEDSKPLVWGDGRPCFTTFCVRGDRARTVPKGRGAESRVNVTQERLESCDLLYRRATPRSPLWGRWPMLFAWVVDHRQPANEDIGKEGK